ncbi:MAG: HD domain-containing protein [Myxococcaceae bacterium]
MPSDAPGSGLLLKSALDWACVWHRAQLRKYPGVEVPYASHVAGVAAVLARHGFPEPVVAAGALHDTLEDCGVTFEELCRRFGEEVATLVRHVSEEDRTLSWEQRKGAYLEHFKAKPWPAQAISLADKIDNFLSILLCAREHGDPWAMFKRGKQAQLGRFDALLLAARALPAHPLIGEYAQTLERVRATPG